MTANLALVATAVFTGISQGIQPLISHAYGQRDRRAEGLVRNKALVLALGLSVLLFLAVLLWAPRIDGDFLTGMETGSATSLAGRACGCILPDFAGRVQYWRGISQLIGTGNAAVLRYPLCGALQLFCRWYWRFNPSGTGWYLAEFSGSGAVRSCSQLSCCFFWEPPHQNRKSGRNRKKLGLLEVSSRPTSGKEICCCKRGFDMRPSA